jgi:hypothetical protein
MGRMKEIFMEVYEQHDGNIPVDFDFDAYIEQKVKQSQEQEEMSKEKFSTCCGVEMSTLTSQDGPSFEDLGIVQNVKNTVV